MKKILSMLVLSTVVLLGMQGNALANHGKSGGGICLEAKFFETYHKMMEHRKELELSEDQMTGIKNIKMSVKRAKAEADGIKDVATIDIYQEIYLAGGNLEAIHGLIDQKIEADRNVAHAVVKGLLDYKALLSKDQADKLKDIWYDEKYSEDKSGWGKCKKCGHAHDGKQCHKN